MRNRLSYVLLAAGALVGCGTTPVPTDTNVIVLETGMPDGGGADVGRDAPDTGPVVCSSTGLVGAHCRMMACQGASTRCLADTPGQTVLQAFTGLLQGDLMDPAHEGYQAIHVPQDPASSAPFNAFAGSFCAQQCDTSATTDTCGTCTSCNSTVTQLPLVAAFGGARAIFGTTAMFGANTGLCRIDCTWNATGPSSECPDNMACDGFGSVCIESCTADSECNTTYGATYDSQLVVVVNDQNPESCNATTGRCESAGTAGAVVGQHCDSNNDCLPGSGICLSGGLCAEFGCNGTTPLCGTGNVGVCVGVNATSHPQTLCLKGCNTAADCGAGNICSALTGMAGTFTGICIGVCNTDDECMASETCTDFTTTTGGMTTSNPGRCVPRCGQTGAPIHVGDVGTGTTTAGDCATDEWCQADHVGAAYGQCTGLGGFCGAANTTALPARNPATEVADCSTTQVCDETLATPHGTTGAVIREDFLDGHCADACETDADCTGGAAGAVCVTDTASPLHGLCRVACSATMTTCPTDQTCNTTLGFCVEVAPPAAAP